LILECLDPNEDAQKALAGKKTITPKTTETFNDWRSQAAGLTWPSDFEDYINGWKDRASSSNWPESASCLDLLYALVHWLPYLRNTPDGLILLEVFTRQISACEQLSKYKARVIETPSLKNKNLASVKDLLTFFLAPIASGVANISEGLMDQLPHNKLNILSIHQSKGLEFPLVIVDVGSALLAKNSWWNHYLRFPEKGSQTHHLEDLMREHTPLASITSSREGEDRAFDDLYRLYFVAFSRPETILLLVGLNDVHPNGGSVLNIATGCDRVGGNWWSNPNLPFLEI